MHISTITADISSTHCFAINPKRQRELAEVEEAGDGEEGEVYDTPIRGIISDAWIKDSILSVKQDKCEEGRYYA